MIAAWRGHSSIVTELVRAGAQVDAQDQVYKCVCMCVCACTHRMMSVILCVHV
jgi:hypothetical protein